MPAHSIYLAKLSAADRKKLETSLLEKQSGVCFLCNKAIDLTLQPDVHIDHVQPISQQGPDHPNNFALTHGVCNEKKGSTNLEIARRLFHFEELQASARKAGDRGADLDDILRDAGGKGQNLALKIESDVVRYTFAGEASPVIHTSPLFTDERSGIKYFFAVLPVNYLHHDDRINPRPIGGSLKGLMEEFYAGRPQLHVSLAWWTGDPGNGAPVKVFDGQHKAAAQILLGAKRLPVRIFLNPDLNVLLQANTNAGDKLKQVAFDQAVKRHLGNTLFQERVREYRKAKQLSEGDESFSEQDLVSYFKGSKREMQRYVVDAVRSAITQDSGNELMPYVEMAGRGVERPISYSAIEKTFFSIFLYPDTLATPLDYLEDQQSNPRFLEHSQMVRLMNIYSKQIVSGRWNFDSASGKLEHRLRSGDLIPEKHICAHRMTREEVIGATLEWVAHIMKQYNALVGNIVEEDQLLQTRIPDVLWTRIEHFLQELRNLPCWVDKNLSNSIFGAKSDRETWKQVFKTGKTPNGVAVLTEPLDLQKMIQ